MTGDFQVGDEDLLRLIPGAERPTRVADFGVVREAIGHRLRELQFPTQLGPPWNCHP